MDGWTTRYPVLLDPMGLDATGSPPRGGNAWRFGWLLGMALIGIRLVNGQNRGVRARDTQVTRLEPGDAPLGRQHRCGGATKTLAVTEGAYLLSRRIDIGRITPSMDSY